LASEYKFLIISTPSTLSATARCAYLPNWAIKLFNLQDEGDWWVIMSQALHACLPTAFDCLKVVIRGAVQIVGGVSLCAISHSYKSKIFLWLQGQITVASNAHKMLLLIYALSLT